jgi:ectoine hydroxylase-related dioxygenase (phytanoyl-CoA dioxygenase family)
MVGHRIATLAELDHPARVAFLARGFLAVDRFVDDHALDGLRAAYDDVIARRTVAAGDRQLGGIIRQVKAPSTAHPVFAANDAIAAGVRVASQLFGHEHFDRFYEMLIDKPAGTPHATPWHQDIGYFGRPVVRPGTSGRLEDIQIWVALDDVDEGNGCMQFLETPFGSPALAHVVAAGDPDDEGRLVALADLAALPVERVVPCPLPAGGATMHFISTPHFTGPNLTADRPRRAYIFNIGPAGFAAASAATFEKQWGRPPDGA